jgi:hypothetical protein
MPGLGDHAYHISVNLEVRHGRKTASVTFLGNWCPLAPQNIIHILSTGLVQVYEHMYIQDRS